MSDYDGIPTTRESAYDVMMSIVAAGNYVALIPAVDVDGEPVIYNRWAPVSSASVVLGLHPDPAIRAHFALGLLKGSHDLARQRGLIPLA